MIPQFQQDRGMGGSSGVGSSVLAPNLPVLFGTLPPLSPLPRTLATLPLRGVPWLSCV